MRKILLFACNTLTVVSACRNANKPNELLHHRFKTDVMLGVTPVENQESSSPRQAYAMLGTIESGRLMMDDSVNLSVDYLARMLLKGRARRPFFVGGRGRVSLRGTASMALRLSERYGMLHEDTYDGKQANYNVLTRKTQLATSRSVDLQKMDGRVDEILDAEAGFMPWSVFFRHAEYTPRQPAHNVYLSYEYLSLASFTHHLYGHSPALEISDNWYRDALMSVSLGTLMAHVKRALQTGHPVCWGRGVSGPGSSFARGMAKLPNGAVDATPVARQRQLETLETVDDYCIVLVGLVHDRRGNTYYIARNSWGKNSPFGGYMYLGDNYLRLKTVAVRMSQAAYGM